MNRFDYGCAAVIAACAIGIGCIFAAEPPPVPLQPAPADPQPPAWLNPSPLWVDNPANAGWWVQKPPARYMVGKGMVIVLFTDPETVERECGGQALACAYAGVLGDGTEVKYQIMPDPCAPGFAGERYAQLQCHETSHSYGGWKHELA